MNVFVDTAAWIALANADDALHEQITQVFTSDRHFEQAGFVKLL